MQAMPVDRWIGLWTGLTRALLPATAALLLVFAGPLGPAAADDADDADDEQIDPEALLERVIAQLTAEAEDLDEFGDDRETPETSRPHPLIEGHERELAMPALERMQDEFTGNEYRDTYVRWHLLWAGKQLMEQQLERYFDVGEHELPAGTTQRLLELLRGMPEPIQWERLPEYRYEPREKRSEYLRLRRQTEVRVGYPPFDRTYRGRSALEYVSDERREEVERIVEQMEEVRQQYEVIRDDDARAVNSRIRWMNRTLRQYRGELIYALMQTGDDELFQRAIVEIGEQINADQWAAFDLMRYLYLAAMDGYLLLFDESSYQRAARDLRRIAEANDEYRQLLFGDEPPPRYYRPQQRNFGEYAFHMVHLLEDPGAVAWFQQRVAPPERAGLRRRDVEFTPHNFTMDDVRAARDAAVNTLLDPDASQRLRPTYDLQGSRMDRLRTASSQSVRRQELIHEFGNQALAMWALLNSGENYQDPRLFRRINWVLTSDAPYTFDRGMRLQMLAQMPAERWRPWIRRDLRWLTDAMNEHGNWGFRYTGEEPTGWGDHANGAYGLLGLWAAQQMNVEIPLSVWQTVDEHWRTTQHQGNGGWAVGMFNVEEEESDDPRDALRQRVSGPMTATGVAALTLTERYLYSADRTDPDEQNVSTHLLRGIDWLDNNFSLHSDDPAMDWYYYMWTVQRVGEASGHRAFNDVDWFRDVAAEILNRQTDEGLWEDQAGRQGALVSTSFALLYLANAYDPIGISKLRFDGRWNNRPNDLLNFVEWASDQYQVRTGWQIASADRPVFQLIEAPLLYVATNDAFELDEAEIERLREYVEAGGMLVLNPDRQRTEVARSFSRLTEALFPDHEMQDVPRDHALYRVHQRLQPNVRMRMIDNGVRPLAIRFVRDQGEDLQANRVGRSEAFDVLSNIYLYAVSLNARRNRLESNYIVPAEDLTPSRSIRVARLAHGGTHDPEPGAMRQLAAMMAQEHDVAVEHETLDPTALSDQSLALMTTLGDAELSGAQIEAIRDWIDRGGTLWLDAVGGSRAAVENARELLDQLAPDTAARPLSSRSPVITGDGIENGYDNRRTGYRYFALREMGPVTTPRLQAVQINDRPAIIFSPEDLTAGLAGLEHWGIFGYDVRAARQFFANAILEALE